MSSEIVKRLRDRRHNVWEQSKEVADRAADENRAFTAEEQGTWDGLMGELDALDKRIKAALEVEERAKAADDAFDKLAGKPADKTKPQAPETGELRAFLLGEPGAPRSYEVRPSGPVDYRNILKSGTAGSVVPTNFYDRLVAHLIEVSAVLQAGPMVLNTSGGESIQVPKTLTHSAGAIVAEAGTIATSEPTFAQITLGAYKYGLVMYLSRELVADEGVDLEGYLAMQAGRAIGNAFGAHMVTGTGTGQPRGIVTDATLGVTGGATVAGAFTADNLIDLHFSVIAPYRASRSAGWIVKDSSLGGIRKLKDGAGRYLFEPAATLGEPDTLLGKPIVTDPNVAAVALSAKSVLFGDFSQYFVRLAGGIRFERSDDFKFDADLVAYRALLRADAALVDLTGAIKFFAGNAA